MFITIHTCMCVWKFCCKLQFLCHAWYTLSFEQDLEREVEKLSQTHENLRRAECEIHTLKSFLTSKTAIVERRKKELQDVKTRLAELEEKDNRRAVILADVLEKTARQYQQQLTVKTATPGATKTVSFQLQLPKSDLRGTLPSDRYRALVQCSENPMSGFFIVIPLLVLSPTQAI